MYLRRRKYEKRTNRKFQLPIEFHSIHILRMLFDVKSFLLIFYYTICFFFLRFGSMNIMWRHDNDTYYCVTGHPYISFDTLFSLHCAFDIINVRSFYILWKLIKPRRKRVSNLIILFFCNFRFAYAILILEGFRRVFVSMVLFFAFLFRIQSTVCSVF